MRRWAHRTHLAGTLLASILGAACGPSSGRPAGGGGRAAIQVVDDAGRTVALAGPAQRIVSLAPSSTELLFAIGAGGRVVGRTTWCKYPPAALAVAVVGDGLNPSLEAVAAQHPDLVVLYHSPLNETAAAQFARIGIPALLLRQDRLEDVAHGARLLGSLTGRGAAGDSLAAAFERLLASASAAPRTTSSRVAIVVWDNPPIVIGAGSYLDQLVTLAGGTNVFHDLAAASATVSLETLAARDPDLIAVLSDSTPSPVPGYAARREWRVVRAVRDRRFLSLDAALFGRPSPRAAEAVAKLRARFEGRR